MPGGFEMDMVIEDVINFWLRIEKLSKNLRHPCLVWEIGCVWWLIFCVAVYLYTWSSSLVSRMWPFWKRSTGLVTRPWPPLLMFYISRSHKSNHPTNCGFILRQKKENLKNVGSGREIRCFPTQKGGNLQKILKSIIKPHCQFLVFCSTIWDVDVIARGVWSSGVAKKDLLAQATFPTEIYPFGIWEFLKFEWIYPIPSRICANQSIILLQNENTLKHHTVNGVSLVGISLMIFPNCILTTPGFSNNTTRILKVKRKKCLPDLHILTNVIYIYKYMTLRNHNVLQATHTNQNDHFLHVLCFKNSSPGSHIFSSNHPQPNCQRPNGHKNPTEMQRPW